MIRLQKSSFGYTFLCLNYILEKYETTRDIF
jgi:hypothetical protein